VSFEPNVGQTDPRVAYLARGRGFVLFLEGAEAVFATRDGGALRMRLAGASPGAAAEGEGLLPGVSHYFLGNDPARWRSSVPHRRSVRVRGVLPGVDLRWHGQRGAVEYEFRLAPGASAETLALEFEGASGVEVEAGGDLLVHTTKGVLRHSRPVAWQPGSDGRRGVEARFAAEGRSRARLRLGSLDPALPCVVDPRLEYASYLGGNSSDGTSTSASRVAVDSSSAIYLAGASQSTDYPTASAYQQNISDGGTYGDAVITKLNAAGSALVYSTYLGGNYTDYANALAVETSGAVTVGGSTNSTNFPVVAAFQPTRGGDFDGWVARLSVSGSTLTFATHLGASSTDHLKAIAVDGSGAIYATGYTASSDFPTQSPLQSSRSGAADAFVTKLSSSGSALSYSTYLGGSGLETGQAIAIDSSGNCFVTGSSDSTNFPLQGAFQAAYGGGNQDGFVAKIASSGTSLIYSSYLGGSGVDYALGIAVDGGGAAVVTGITGSSNFPLQSPLQGTYGGGTSDAFVAKIAVNGASKTFSTFLGGSGGDTGAGVAADSSGAIYVTGYTYSADFPVASAVQGTKAGDGDAFLTKLNSAGSALSYSTYLGGTALDVGNGLALDGTSAIVSGYTASTDFPTQSPYQGTNAGLQDAFVARVVTMPLPPSGLAATLAAADGIQIDWADNSDNETGFDVQRRSGNSGPYSTVGSVGAGVTTYSDAGLSRGTKYTYRVRAVSPDGPSGWSNEDSETTLPLVPGAPLTPSDLAAVVASATRVDVSWSDNSDNELYFQFQRRLGEGAWQVVATPGPDATGFADVEVLPDRAYSWRVRAYGSAGFSDYSETAVASTPSTVVLAVEKGNITDSPKVGKDKVKASGTYSFGPDSPDGAWDPSQDGFEVRLGGQDATPLVAIPGGAPGWVEKNGVFTWKSPKGSPTKAKVTVDTVQGRFSLSLSKATLLAAPANPIRVSVSAGDDAGGHEADWTPHPRKAGVFRYP